MKKKLLNEIVIVVGFIAILVATFGILTLVIRLWS